MSIRDTLLLVNDDAASRDALQTAFEKNYNLLEAENGEQALLLMEENHGCIAAVVLDTLMPVKSGYEVLREMARKELLSELPVIIVTDESAYELEARLFDMGVSDVIIAPYDLHVVQRRVENVVALNRKGWRLEEVLEKQSKIPQHTNEIMVDGLASIIEYRSPESGQHIQRMRRFTQLLLEDVAVSCPEYNLTPSIITLIVSAATLHDVGKISVPDSILHKPERLTPEEMAVMQTHSLAGCRILERMNHIADPEYLRYAHNICHYHHERWDGNGYPEGLKGDDIPICAQVVGLADVYDALTCEQVYKQAYPHGLAMSMILNGDCGVFSPKLLECLKHVSDQFAEVSSSYEDGASSSDQIAAPLPGPTPQEGFDTLQSVQLKYHALLHHLNATVLEIDLDNDFYHLVYNTDPSLDFLSTENAFAGGLGALIGQLAPPEELDSLSQRFTDHIHTLVEGKLRKLTQHYELYNAAAQQRQWYECTFLRIEPLDADGRRIMLVCHPLAQPPAALSAEKSSLSEDDIYQLLAGVYCCRNDLWLTLDGDITPLSSLLGYTEQELRIQFQSRLMNLVLPEDRQMIRRQMTEQLARSRSIELEYRLLRKDGQIIWVLNKGHLVAKEYGMEYIYCVLVDITQTKQTLDRLHQSLERHQIIMAQTDDIVFEWDMVSDHVICSNKWQALFGFEPPCANFSSRVATSSHFHPDDLPLFLERMHSLKNGADYQDAELRIAKSDGRYLWCRLRATAQYGADGKPFKAVGVIINIDAEKRAAQALQSKAERDSLTKLLNKNTSRHQVEARLLGRRPEDQAALLIIDLDNFKMVNDYHGHLFGDTVITQTAAEIRRFFRSDDIIARIGGDEFMVFMSNIPSRELVQRRCAGMMESFCNLFKDRLSDCGLSCSIGVALAPEHGISFEELFQHADQALYRAKAQGKNRCAFYNISDHDFLPKSAAVSAARTAIDSDSRRMEDNSGLVHYVFRRLYDSAEPEKAIHSVLELIGQKMHISRAYIFETDPGGKTCSNTFEWCAKGIRSEMENRQKIAPLFPDYEEQFNARGVFYCPDITILPRAHYDLLASQGVKSTLQCAIRDGGAFRGYVGFDECTTNQVWTQDKIDLLTVLSEILSLFLLKKRAQDQLEH